MNGPFAQLAAVGVIAAVAIFPTPDKVRSIFEPEPAPTAVANVEIEPELTTITELASYDTEVAMVVELPFPSDCLPDHKATDLSSWFGCKAELSSFISAHEAGVPRTRSLDSNTVVMTIPEVEEARRALAEICRAEWAAGEISDIADSPDCAALR